MNEKGAVLPSVIVFVFLLVVILLGSINVYHNQMHQLFATKESYNAKAMLIMTEHELTSRLDNSEVIETGTATFKNGEVQIKQTLSHQYQLTAVTKNHFSLKKQIQHSILESSEVLEETISSEGIQIEKEEILPQIEVNN